MLASDNLHVQIMAHVATVELAMKWLRNVKPVQPIEEYVRRSEPLTEVDQRNTEVDDYEFPNKLVTHLLPQTQTQGLMHPRRPRRKVSRKTNIETAIPREFRNTPRRGLCNNSGPILRLGGPLPVDCTYVVFKFQGDPRSLCQAARVCKTWHKLAYREELWQALYEEHFHFVMSAQSPILAMGLGAPSTTNRSMAPALPFAGHWRGAFLARCEALACLRHLNDSWHEGSAQQNMFTVRLHCDALHWLLLAAFEFAYGAPRGYRPGLPFTVRQVCAQQALKDLYHVEQGAYLPSGAALNVGRFRRCDRGIDGPAFYRYFLQLGRQGGRARVAANAALLNAQKAEQREHWEVVQLMTDWLRDDATLTQISELLATVDRAKDT